MKRHLATIILFAVLAVGSADDAEADLIRGIFSGTVRINGNITKIETGAGFVGKFTYDTAALAEHYGASTAQVPGGLIDLSVTLAGVAELYNYEMTNGTFLDVWCTDTGGYQLSNYYLPHFSTNDFIADNIEIEFNFENTYVADMRTPLVMPDAISFNPNSWFYMEIWEGGDLSPYSCQLFGDITYLSLSRLQPVPEPASMILFGAGLAGLAGASRKRRSKS